MNFHSKYALSDPVTLKALLATTFSQQIFYKIFRYISGYLLNGILLRQQFCCESFGAFLAVRSSLSSIAFVFPHIFLAENRSPWTMGQKGLNMGGRFIFGAKPCQTSIKRESLIVVSFSIWSNIGSSCFTTERQRSLSGWKEQACHLSKFKSDPITATACHVQSWRVSFTGVHTWLREFSLINPDMERKYQSM